MPKKKPNTFKLYPRTLRLKKVLKDVASNLRQIITNNHINNL